MMVLPPIMAHLEQDLFAEVLYNANEPLCHQYIGRSFCVYNNWMVNDCDLNKTANVTTEFNYYLTNKYSVVASKFDGEYSYNRNLVGIHRAERIDYEDGIYAYKLGVCARDTAIFLGLLFAPLIYFLLKSKIKSTPHILIAFLFLVPMGLDGVGQLIGLWESTNLIRLMTGLIAGLGIGYFLYAILVDINKKKKEEK
jgi:uncharacterized membrane protein